MSWLNRAVPIQGAGRVRVVTCEGCIPGVGNAIVGITPSHSPAVDSRCAVVSDAHCALEAGVPFIVERIRADCRVRLAGGSQTQT